MCLLDWISINNFRFILCQDCSVCITTRYGLDCPGIEFLLGHSIPHPSRPASYSVGIESLSRRKSGRVVALIINLHLAPRLK